MDCTVDATDLSSQRVARPWFETFVPRPGWTLRRTPKVTDFRQDPAHIVNLPQWYRFSAGTSRRSTASVSSRQNYDNSHALVIAGPGCWEIVTIVACHCIVLQVSGDRLSKGTVAKCLGLPSPEANEQDDGGMQLSNPVECWRGGGRRPRYPRWIEVCWKRLQRDRRYRVKLRLVLWSAS